ncbi:TIGR04104 family putative zinc finger protein [Planococcus sp. CAU13]|uniref:TIGR04104 family putative zinc finger protein n=1 Tax=Planococcus sp. CAU13 TaxID=1541197 RepID=UPI0005300753
MPNCQNCNYQWSWFDTFKIGFMNNKKCPNCQERQYIKPQANKRIYVFYIVPLIILLFSRPLFDWSTPVFLSIGFFFIFALTLIIPYTIKLSNEQEPLF